VNELSSDSKFSIIETLSKYYSRNELRKYGFKFSNASFTSKNVAVNTRTNNTHTRKQQALVEQFLVSYWTPAANTIVLINNEPIAVQLLPDTISSMYHAFVHKYGNVITFHCCIPKNFKHSSKATDLCAQCEQGKKLVKTYEADIKWQAKRLKDKKQERKLEMKITELKHQFEEYKKHQTHKNNQRDAFNSHKSSIDSASLLLVLDFKENVYLGSGPHEVSADFYDREARIVFGIVAYYIKNEKIVKEYWNVISLVLNHDSKFVLETMKLVLEQQATLIKQFSKLIVWSDGGPHFCNKTAATILPKTFHYYEYV